MNRNTPYGTLLFRPGWAEKDSFGTAFLKINLQKCGICGTGGVLSGRRFGTSSARFTFTGKERDSESGLYYFGARYHDPALLTSFLSVDPLSDKYPSISPYAYCAWTRPTGGHEHLLIKFNLVNNPMKLVDPDGREMWKPDSDGNLIAEKGDNAWTLAAYLNTTPSIAKRMLDDQGYSVNSEGVLNLKEGDIFNIDFGETESFSDIDLGRIGNYIRQKANSGIAKDLFTNHWQGGGDITLSGSQFAGILMYIKESNQSPTESDGNSKIINFYNSEDYDLAFGRASITVDGKQRITGFSDTYDFDSKKGQRTIINEFKNSCGECRIKNLW